MERFRDKMDAVLDELTRQSVTQGVIGQEQEIVYRYGIKHLVISCIYLLSYWVIGAVTHNYRGLLLYLLFFTALRVFAGGFHMQRRITCYIVTISMVYAISMMIKGCEAFEIGGAGHLLVCVSYMIIMRYAPLEHKNRKFDREEQRVFRKISVVILNIETFLYLFCVWREWNHSAFILLICLVQEAVLILLGLRENGGEEYEESC